MFFSNFSTENKKKQIGSGRSPNECSISQLCMVGESCVVWPKLVLVLVSLLYYSHLVYLSLCKSVEQNKYNLNNIKDNLLRYYHNIISFTQQLPRHRSAEGALFWTFCLDNWQLLRWYALQIQPTGTDRTGKNLQGLYKMKLNNLCCGKVGYEQNL